MTDRKGVMQISEVANGVLDPVLAKRAGINTMLLGMCILVGRCWLRGVVPALLTMPVWRLLCLTTGILRLLRVL